MQPSIIAMPAHRYPKLITITAIKKTEDDGQLARKATSYASMRGPMNFMLAAALICDSESVCTSTTHPTYTVHSNMFVAIDDILI